MVVFIKSAYQFIKNEGERHNLNLQVDFEKAAANPATKCFVVPTNLET